MSSVDTALTLTHIFVPFSEKDAARALGARWDSREKLWYVVRGLDLSAFSRWRDPRSGPPTPPQPARATASQLVPARRSSASARAPATASSSASARGNGIVCVGALFKGAEALDYPPWLDAPPAREAEATPALLEYI